MNIVKLLKSNIIIYLIIAISPLIDIIYTINTKFLSIDFPFQQIIRIVIVIYLFLNIKIKENRVTIIGLGLLFLLGQIYIIINKYDYNIVSNFSYILKILNLFCIVAYTKEKLDYNFIKLQNVIKSLKVASIILSSNIILSNTFKIGLKTYDYGDRSGYKGFIEAHNDITIVLLMILPIIVCEYFKYKRNLDAALIIIISISLLMIGPKAGKILLLLEIIVLLANNLKSVKVSRLTKKISIFISIIISLFLLTNFSYMQNRIEKYAQGKGYRSVYSYIVSYRDIQPRLIDNAIGDKFEVHPKYLFGMGYFYANKELNNEKKEFYSIENDFEGLIYYNGLVTSAIIVYLIANWILKVFKNKKIDKDIRFYVIIALSIGIIHSFLGGHVLYSAISNTYFSIILAIGCYKCEENKKLVSIRGV
ncbi:MAG: O-antigen ligase family protein [Clostridium sp.]|nr:O-antigen ligase family protein [Clostridium sp.]